MPANGGSGLDGLTGAVKHAAAKGPPPVHLWNPPFCGDIDMRIDANGLWFYMGTPIGRPALVKLFASVLKREDGRHYLVTPVEKVGIIVEDAPFSAVELTREAGAQGDILVLRTSVDDVVRVDGEHPLRFRIAPESGALTPYVHVRRDLWARLTRAITYDLIEMGETRMVAGVAMFGVASGPEFYPMLPASDIEGLSA
jgi:hypothetical protein